MGPQDVDVVRRQMMAKLGGKHQKHEIEQFFYEKVNRAFFDFSESVETPPVLLSVQKPHGYMVKETSWMQITLQRNAERNRSNS